jgi:hypothetical protein
MKAAVNWQTIQTFLEKELEKGPQQGDLLYNSLVVLYQMLLGYLALTKHLEPPENRGMRGCPWCKKEFKPLYAHTVACSDECERLWRLYPSTVTKELHDKAVAEVLRMNAEERAQS